MNQTSQINFNRPNQLNYIAFRILKFFKISCGVILASFGFFSLSHAYSKNITEYRYDNDELQKLANHKQWQHLLFYKNGRAEVISPNFYLSDPQLKNRKKFSPYNELLATLNQSKTQSVVCKYPARYYWLKHHLPKLKINLSMCSDLPNPQQDISLILVSSYLKNPASTFGHVLIKTHDQINHKAHYIKKQETQTNEVSVNQVQKDQIHTKQVKINSSEDLLNQSYNFGAKIPEKESGVLYALKGLFGFYDAGFARADFFKQDAIYSKNEQRDMWEYVLNLDEFDNSLLNYHLYEAQFARFSYYFIKQNCGYRTGEILELVSDISITDRIGGWYAPDFIFDQLVEYDEHQNSMKPLIKKMNYMPSEQTQLRQKFQKLPKNLQNIVNEFILDEDINKLSKINNKEQALVIDFLVTHRNYKISQVDKEEKIHHQNIKKQLISKRFILPTGNEFEKLAVQFKPSPALSNKTTQTSVSISDQGVKTALTLFVKDPLNDYTEINKRFNAVKLSTQYDFNRNHIEFDEFTFLDMQQIENYGQSMVGEPRMSWQLKTGIQIDPVIGNGHITYFDGGVGTGFQSSNDNYEIATYGFVNTHLHDQKTLEYKGIGLGVDISGQLGLRVKDKIKNRSAQIEHSIRKRDSKDSMQTTNLIFRQSINKNNDIRFNLSYDNNPNINSNINYKEKLNGQLIYHHYW